MEDLIQCFAANKGFQRWLSFGKIPLTVYKDEKAAAMLVKLDKKQGVDYLYQAAVGKDNSISWDKSLMFCGLYDMKSQALYLTEDTVRSLSDGQYPLVTINCPSKVKEICGRLNLRVEEIIANDRNNLLVREVTDGIALHNLHYYQEYGAKEDAIRKFFDDEAPDGQFHSDYAMDGLRETAFLAYIQDPDGFIQAEAEKYIKANQENICQGGISPGKTPPINWNLELKTVYHNVLFFILINNLKSDVIIHSYCIIGFLYRQ